MLLTVKWSMMDSGVRPAVVGMRIGASYIDC